MSEVVVHTRVEMSYLFWVSMWKYVIVCW